MSNASSYPGQTDHRLVIISDEDGLAIRDDVEDSDGAVRGVQLPKHFHSDQILDTVVEQDHVSQEPRTVCPACCYLIR